MFRWGILSTAKIAREHVIPAMHASSNGSAVGIASRDAERAAQFAAQCGVAMSFGCYEDMLASPEIDGVYIGVTTAQHVEWTLKAIAAGKHVLCEKPMALSAADIQTVSDAAARAEVKVAEAFMVHYHPQWQRVSSWLADGRIGDLKRVQGAFSYFNRDPGNMRNQLALGGGAIPDIGVYPLVTTRLATGEEPVSVRATVERDPEFGTDRFANIQMTFPGFEMSYYVSSQMHAHQSMTFAGTDGWILVDTPFNTGVYGHATVRLATAEGEHVERFPENHYTLQLEAFARAVQSGEDTCMTLESSWRNQLAIDAIYASSESGLEQPVSP